MMGTEPRQGPWVEKEAQLKRDWEDKVHPFIPLFTHFFFQQIAHGLLLNVSGPVLGPGVPM